MIFYHFSQKSHVFSLCVLLENVPPTNDWNFLGTLIGIKRDFPLSYLASIQINTKRRSEAVLNPIVKHSIKNTHILVCILSHGHYTQTSSWCQLLSVSLSLLCLSSSTWKQPSPPVVWKLQAAGRAVCRLTGKPSLPCYYSRVWHAVCAWKKQNKKAPPAAIEWRQELTNFLWLFQADLKSEIFVLGKPPRSPVMSRRPCSSPVRGLSSSHRVGSERPALRQAPWPPVLSRLALP